MKALAGALIGWTVISLALVFLVPGVVNTPGCAHKVDVTSDCQALLATLHDAGLTNHTLPLVVAIVAGYAVVLALAVISHLLRSQRLSR
jgi:hypothetical protein